MAVEVLALDDRSGIRGSRAGLAIAVGLVLAAVLTGWVVTQRARARIVTPEQARQALAASFPERAAPVPLAPPGRGTPAPAVIPEPCRLLLLRPWLGEAWPVGAASGFRTGTPGVDSYPSSEAFTFTTRRPADAERLFADSRSALASHTCDRARVEPGDPTGQGFRVSLRPEPRDPAEDGACALLSYVAAASPPQLGSPESVTVELLQYRDTISLLVQLSERDVLIFAGSYLSKDRERPSLTTLCGELQRGDAGG